MKFTRLKFTRFFAAVMCIWVSLNANAAPEKNEEYLRVTAKQVVASPAEYHGKLVVVYGLLIMKVPQLTAISTLKCGPGSSGVATAIGLELSPTKDTYSQEELDEFFKRFKAYSNLHHRCVWVIGQYDQTLQVGMGRSTGGIRNIRSISKTLPPIN